jgi:uncharacterized protein (DUF433 family)
MKALLNFCRHLAHHYPSCNIENIFAALTTLKRAGETAEPKRGIQGL